MTDEEATKTAVSGSLIDVIGGAPVPPATPLIRIDNVCKTFGVTDVLRNVNLDVAAGECVCIVGPSGSGKSTLLRCINHLEAPTSGHVTVRNHHIGFTGAAGKKRASESKIAAQRRETGMVFQRFNLFPHMCVLENVISGLLRVEGKKRAEAEPVGMALLERVGLGDKAKCYPAQLSGGQQQRVAIVRALAMRPAVMLFDEPTSALDPEMIGEVLGVIEELRHDGMTMLIVTHEMKFARKTADWIVMMDHGRIVERSRPDQFFDHPSDPRSEQFLSKIL